MSSAEYKLLTTTTTSPAKVGLCKRLHILKVILVIGTILTILNLFNYRFDMKLEKLSFLHTNSSQQTPTPSSASLPLFGPKRLRPNLQLKLQPMPIILNSTSRHSNEPTSIKQPPHFKEDKSSHKPDDGPRTTPTSGTNTIFDIKNNIPDNRSGAPIITSRSMANNRNESVPSNHSSSATPSHPFSPHVPTRKADEQKQKKQPNRKANELVQHPRLDDDDRGSYNRTEATNNKDLPTTTSISLLEEDEKDRLKYFKAVENSSSPSSLAVPDGNSSSFSKYSGYIQTTSMRSVTFLSKLMTKLGINACPERPPDLHGPLDVNLSRDTIAEVEARMRPFLLPGGWYRPVECNAKDRVAIIIPYRDREEHLPVLLKNLHPMLMRQQVNYGIFVVEETKADPFNRASLMNVGFLEANKMENWDCFIFHDVDLIPLDDRNLYRCPEQPRHMSVAVDVFEFKLPYFTIFGGVSALTTQQFHSVNGFSNLFWGWGGEDDDMSNRIRFLGYHISRYPMNIARYTMLSHPKAPPNPKRYEKLSNGLKRYENDGLNSVKYELVDNKKFPLFTWLLVKLQPELVVGKPKGESDNDFRFLKYFLLILMSTLLLCIFKLLFV